MTNHVTTDARKRREEREGHEEAVRLATDGNSNAAEFDARLIGEPAWEGEDSQ